MRPAIACAIVLAVLVPAGPLVVSPARAAGFSACGLTGLVRTGGRPCPLASTGSSAVSGSPSAAGVPTPGGTLPAAGSDHADFLGISVGGLLGSVAGRALTTIVGWVVDGAASALRYTTHLISETTEPSLQSSWFSASYWRMAAIAALLTIPFLCAAAVHALVRSDLGLLARAAFGYLPLAMLGVAVAAPLTTLVLSATDEMSVFVTAASGHADATFLGRAATTISAASVVEDDPFLAFFVAIATVAATLALWVELAIRAAAVDVIVLMLPLFFAAMVWPARRVWAIRAIETLISLILAKFVIVSVLALGGAAIAHSPSDGLGAMVTGVTLVLLATLSPWALLRILPMHEVAAAAVGGLSAGPRAAVQTAGRRLMGDESSGGERTRDGNPVADPGEQSLRNLDAVAARNAPSGAGDSAPFDQLTQLGVDAVAHGGSGETPVGVTAGTVGGAAGSEAATDRGGGTAELDGPAALPELFEKRTKWRAFELGAEETWEKPLAIPDSGPASPRGGPDPGDDLPLGPDPGVQRP